MLLIHTGFATKVLEWNRDPDPVEIHRMCTYLDARDESLLEWIAESQIAALVADNYAVEGLRRRGSDPRAGTRCSRSTTSASSSSAFRSARCGTSHELATWLRAHNRSRFLLTAPPLRLPGVVGSPSHRSAAPSRPRQL